MKNLLFVLMIMICGICLGQPKKDTTFLLKEFLTDGSYHAVFVEKNKNSSFYTEVKNPFFDKQQYDDYLTKAKDSFAIPLKKEHTKALVREWYPLMLYKNKYYVYLPSDGGVNPWVTFTDSTMIEMYFDPGVLPSVLKKIRTLNQSTFEIEFANIVEGKQSMKIHIIDRDKGLAIFERSYWPVANRYTLMVAKDKIKNYPLIVNYCKDSRTNEWTFDVPNFEKLLHQKQ